MVLFQAFIQALIYNRQTVVKTQYWIEFWNLISSILFTYLFVFLSRKKP